MARCIPTSQALALALALALAACACPSRPATGPGGGGPVAVDGQAAGPPPAESDAMTSSFVPGPPLSPSGPLLTWLQAHGGEPRKLLRLPVVVTFSNPGRFAIGRAWIGGAPADAPPADAVELRLDDTGLKVSLVEHVRARCADDEAMSCALWLDGLWGPRVAGDPFGGGALPGAGPARWPFAVVEAGDVVDPAHVMVFAAP